MGRSTNIEWCDSTVNPTEHCDGCELWMPKKGVKICYAGNLTERFHGPGSFDSGLLLKRGRMLEAANWPDLEGTERVTKPWVGKLPRLIFVSDMSDALSKSVTFQYLFEEIIKNVVSDAGRLHVWLWPTKRPSRMAEFSKWLLEHGERWPANLWPITSITSQKTVEARIPALLSIGDNQTVHGLSVEPIWEQITIPDELMARLKWIITGGESEQHGVVNKTKCEDLFDLVGLGLRFNVKTFVKQLGSFVTLNGKRIHLKHEKGGDWYEWEGPLAQLRRREFPAPVPMRARQEALL